MKAAVALILTLGVLSAGLMVGANVVIHRQGDQVTVRAETVAGDPAAAEGLEVSLPADYNSQLLWDISFPAPRPEDRTVSFIFALEPRWASYLYDDPPLTVQLNSGSVSYSGAGASSAVSERFPWGEAIEYAFNQLQPGQSGTFQIRPAQLYQYFPIEMYGTRQYTPPDQSPVDYFPIPIPQDYTITVTAGKDENGMETEFSLEDDSRYIINLSALSYDAGDHLIFTLTNTCTRWNDNDTTTTYPLDGSHIEGGWGIYRLDMGADGMTPHLETLYSLPEDSLVADFWGDETGYCLLTQEEGQLRLRVFDPSVRLTQTLDLFSLEGQEYQQTWKGEDYFVPMTYGMETTVSKFAVVSRRDGAWQLDFAQDTDGLRALDVTYFNWVDDYYSPLYMAYNGRTLAIRDTPSRSGTDFYLALYSKEGLEYLGSYSCSLNPPNRGYGGCDLTVPIQSPLLTWTESGS